MKLILRVVAFSLCLAATYGADSFAPQAGPSRPNAPIPTCSPNDPRCSIAWPLAPEGSDANALQQAELRPRR